MHDIGDAKVDKFESSRSQKRTEIIDQLKKKFPGVVSDFGVMKADCFFEAVVSVKVRTIGRSL
jgi:hypothetical protein